MMKLPKTTTYIRVRRYRLVPTERLIQRHYDNLTVINKMHQYAVKYLEKTYGVKHLGRPFPTKKKSKIYLAKDKIIPGFLHDIYGIDKWNRKLVPIHSQALRDEFLVSLITNFGEYRKVLKKAAKMTDQEKEDYRANKHHNNPQHRSWYRKGSLAYLRNGRSHNTVALPSNGVLQVISPHWIKIQDYGKLQVVENICNLKFQKIVVAKIKHKADGTFELQLVLKDTLQRVKPNAKVGADWNMHHEKVFHTSDDDHIYLLPRASILADKYEIMINNLKGQRDRLKKFLSPHCQRVTKLNGQIKYYFARRANLLTEANRQIARNLFQDYDLVAIEQLDAKQMRKEAPKLSQTGNHGKNRHLAKIKPYELSQLLTQVADREGKTLLKVDSYKTSQIEFDTDYVEKHGPEDRHWRSPYTGKQVDRDLNASWNILTWALDPRKHRKYRERQWAIEAAKARGVAEDKLPKPIKPEYLVEVN